MSKESLLSVIIGPHVSEKSARISEGADHFVFRVRPDATKPDIKAAVDLLFEVKVADVNVVNTQGKTKRFGQRFGRVTAADDGRNAARARTAVWRSRGIR